MMNWIFGTQASWAPLFARLALGVILFAHGSQKAIGLWGGGGFSRTLEFFEQNLGIPRVLAILVIVTEFAGGIALILGLFTRIAALGATVLMLTAIYLVHLPNGFFLSAEGNGIEFNLALLGLSIALLFWGGGNLSVDKLIGGEN